MNHLSFIPVRRTFAYQQQYSGTTRQVFPLLCPEREKDWLDGWQYEMIYSESGLIEQDCVFMTNSNGNQPTIWIVTQYDQSNKCIEFVRFSPEECVAKIQIDLEEASAEKCLDNISYQYTALNAKQADFIENHMEEFFIQSMQWWEKALNHYLLTGELLKKVD